MEAEGSREDRAHHEAAHAVVWWWWVNRPDGRGYGDGSFYQVSIEPGPGGKGGHFEWGSRPTPTKGNLAELEHICMGLLAGRAAERRRGLDRADRLKDETEADGWATLYMPDGDVASYLAGIEIQVTEFLGDELVGAMVDSLAAELLAEGTLSYQDAVEAMGEASGNSG